MSVLTGLDAIRKKIEERPKGFDNVRDRNLTQAMESGEKRKIRFLQEFEEDSPHYNEDYGVAIVASEFEHPRYFFIRLVDTSEGDDVCWAAEQGWKSKLNLYVNVLDIETGEVFYIERSALGGLGEQIINTAGESGSITDKVWSLSKTGHKLKTRYNLTPLSVTDDPLDVDPEDLIDFREKVLNIVPSDEQEAFVKQIEQRIKSKNDDADDSDTDDDDDDVW